jgi:hypothetical protein
VALAFAPNVRLVFMFAPRAPVDICLGLASWFGISRNLPAGPLARDVFQGLFVAPLGLPLFFAPRLGGVVSPLVTVASAGGAIVPYLQKGLKRSRDTGSTMVEFWFTAISPIVWKCLSFKAVGLVCRSNSLSLRSVLSTEVG